MVVLSGRRVLATLLVLCLGMGGCTIETNSKEGDPGSGASNPSNPSSPSNPTSPTNPSSPTPNQPGAKVNESEPNDDFAAAQKIGVNDLVSAALESDEAKDDYFVITVPAGKQDGMLDVAVDETDEKAMVEVEIFDANRKTVAKKNSGQGTTKTTTATVEATAGATYYVKVAKWYTTIDAGKSVAYSLTPKFTVVADPQEPNNDFPEASTLALDSDVKFAVFAGVDTNSGEDKDYFKVELPAGKTQLNVKITNASTSQSKQGLRIELFDSMKKELDSATGQQQQNIDKTFDTLTPGTYYLTIDNLYSESNTALHTVRVTAQ